ncbi:MAG TPA: glyoxalase superfamily protein [Candidatus Limnocylindrales bacterium]|nr:glyoxalase superfamily protein [Candidatus Limnocylindrales bacterium]
MDYKLELIVVPVTDVDRAKHFYADMLGFPVDVDDQPNEHFRVVQLTPPGSGCSIAIGIGLGGGAPGSIKGLQLCVADIDAARAELAGRGVPISPVQHHDGSGFVEGKGGDWNAFAFFDDPDGNGWAIQESPTMRAAVQGGMTAADSAAETTA